MEVVSERRRTPDAFHEFAATIVMKKRQLEYREERQYPEYVDIGGEA